MEQKDADRSHPPFLLRVREECAERLVAYTGQDPFLIGRADDCQIVLRDAKASRHHAHLECGAAGVFLVDDGSTNGTRLRGERIERAALGPGDTIEIGEARILVCAPVAAATPEPCAGWPSPERTNNVRIAKLPAGRRQRARLPAFAIAAVCIAALGGGAWYAWQSLPALRDVVMRLAGRSASAPQNAPVSPVSPPSAAPTPKPAPDSPQTPAVPLKAVESPPAVPSAGDPARAELQAALEEAREGGTVDALRRRLHDIASRAPATPATERAREWESFLDALLASQDRARQERAAKLLDDLQETGRRGEAAAVARFLALAAPDADAAHAWEARAAAIEAKAEVALDGLVAALSGLTNLGRRGDALATLLAARDHLGGTRAFEALVPRYLEAALAPAAPPADSTPGPTTAEIDLADRAAAAFEACNFRELVNARYQLLARNVQPERHAELLGELVRALYMEQMFEQWKSALAKEPVEVSLSETFPGRIRTAESDKIGYELDLENRKAAVRDTKLWCAIAPLKKLAIFKAVQLNHTGMVGLIFFALAAGNEDEALGLLASLHNWEKSRDLADAVFSLVTGTPIPERGFLVEGGRLVTPEERAALAARREKREAEARALEQEVRAAAQSNVLGKAIDSALALRRQGSFRGAQAILTAVAARFPGAAEGARAQKIIDDPVLAVVPLDDGDDGGRAPNRLAIHFLAEGYPLDDDAQEAFLATARSMYKLLLTSEPFREYRSYLRADAVHLASRDQGVDRVPGDVVRDTPLGGKIEWDVFTVDAAKALALCARLDDRAAGRIAVVIGNDAAGVATGGGGVAAIPKTSTAALAHELGHALAGLRDEYDFPPGTNPKRADIGKREKSVPVRPLPPNLMEGSDRDTVLAGALWRHWIEAGPDSWWNGAGVAVFEGGNRTPFNVWRPQARCTMRVSGAHFCVVCMEAMLLRLYRTVRPIEALEPAEGELVLCTDETKLVKVYPLKPRSGFLETTWTLERTTAPEQGGPTVVKEEPAAVQLPPHGRRTEPDGRIVEAIRITGAELGAGVFRLSVTVRDPTPWVLRDEEKLLRQTREWTVKIIERAQAGGAAKGQ